MTLRDRVERESRLASNKHGWPWPDIIADLVYREISSAKLKKGDVLRVVAEMIADSVVRVVSIYDWLRDVGRDFPRWGSGSTASNGIGLVSDCMRRQALEVVQTILENVCG